MKLSQLDMINRIADARRALLHRLAQLNAKPDREAMLGKQPFVITIDGERQGDDILELVRPVIAGELRAKVRRLELDLKALGVAIS